jgi:REP element-mobilizing transposase RayT
MKLLAGLKERLPFYLYAYCLMTNHIHLLIERMTDDVGRIMQRLLTGYGQYSKDMNNRRYDRRVSQYRKSDAMKVDPVGSSSM